MVTCRACGAAFADEDELWEHNRSMHPEMAREGGMGREGLGEMRPRMRGVRGTTESEAYRATTPEGIEESRVMPPGGPRPGSRPGESRSARSERYEGVPSEIEREEIGGTRVGQEEPTRRGGITAEREEDEARFREKAEEHREKGHEIRARYYENRAEERREDIEDENVD